MVDITNFNLSLQIDTKSNVNSIHCECSYLLLGENNGYIELFEKSSLQIYDTVRLFEADIMSMYKSEINKNEMIVLTS